MVLPSTKILFRKSCIHVSMYRWLKEFLKHLLKTCLLCATSVPSIACMHAKSLQSCPTLYDPLDCSPPGSSVHEMPQARIPEGVAISFSRESSWPTDQTHVSCVSCIGRWILYHYHHLGSPWYSLVTFTMVTFTKHSSASLSLSGEGRWWEPGSDFVHSCSIPGWPRSIWGRTWTFTFEV